MARFVEWRVANANDDALVVVDPDRGVLDVVTPDVDVLKEFLQVTGDLHQWKRWSGWHEPNGNRDADLWGDLALRRAESGDVDFVDPEVFWDGVRRWFRSRGVDFTR